MLAEGMLLPEWFAQLGPMRWPLLLCSVLALALSLERSVFYLYSWLNKDKQYQKLAAGLQANREWSKALRDESTALALNELRKSYYGNIRGLRIIGGVSPLIGLLGTIFGIIAAFKAIALQSGPVTPSLIADGLWEAMLTTAVGLLIALPALLLTFVFSYFADQRLHDFCARLNQLSLAIALNADNPELANQANTSSALAAIDTRAALAVLFI